MPGYVIDVMSQNAVFEVVETVQAAAALDEREGRLALFVLHADLHEAQTLRGDLRGFADWAFAGHTELAAAHPDDANTFEHPDAIVPRTDPDARWERGILTAALRPASWNVFVFERKTKNA